MLSRDGSHSILKAAGSGRPNMTAQKTVILVSHPGITHNTLAGVLASFSCINVLPTAGALSTVEVFKQASPTAIVIDANLPHEETLALLKHLKRAGTRARCIVLTTTSKHHHELRSAGADLLLFDNCSTRQLEAAVCDSYGSEERGPGHNV
jgi:DNA-binding NarL/FixJ family response regulator